MRDALPATVAGSAGEGVSAGFWYRGAKPCDRTVRCPLGRGWAGTLILGLPCWERHFFLYLGRSSPFGHSDDCHGSIAELRTSLTIVRHRRFQPVDDVRHGLTFARYHQADNGEHKLSDASKLSCDHSARSDAIAASLIQEAGELADAAWSAKNAATTLAWTCIFRLPLLVEKFVSPE